MDKKGLWPAAALIAFMGLMFFLLEQERNVLGVGLIGLAVLGAYDLWQGSPSLRQQPSFYMAIILISSSFIVRLVFHDNNPNSIFWLPCMGGVLLLFYRAGSGKRRNRDRVGGQLEIARYNLPVSQVLLVAGGVWLINIDPLNNLREGVTGVAAFVTLLGGLIMIDAHITMAASTKNLGKERQMPEGQIPELWDESVISGQLAQLRDRPPVLFHYIDSLLDRFVLRQDEQTTQVRISFLQAKLEQLKLVKNFMTSIDDLKMHALERDIRQRELELKSRDLENRQQQQQELDDLRHKLEIAELKKKIRDLEAPPKPVEQPSREEQQRQQRAKAQAEYDRCMKAKRDWLDKILNGRSLAELPVEEEEQYRADEMMWTDRIQRAREELSKHL